MQDFFYDDEFYGEISDLLDDISEKEDLSDLPDDFKIVCKESISEPIFTLDADWIMNKLDLERFPEDGPEWDDIYNMLSSVRIVALLDVINNKIPKCYYPTKEKFVITKKNLLDSL